MNNEFFTNKIITDNRGNITLEGTYDIVGELAYEISRRKESLWKHFCKNVCEQVLSDMGCEPELADFRKVFNRAFENETKKWKEL